MPTKRRIRYGTNRPAVDVIGGYGSTIAEPTAAKTDNDSTMETQCCGYHWVDPKVPRRLIKLQGPDLCEVEAH